MVAAEYLMGRKVGNLYIIAKNSRGIADICSLAHIIHGFIFYYIFGSLICAVLIEVVWEILENSPLIIGRYRKTVAEDYMGDSIINSISDILFMVIGFIVASLISIYIMLIILTIFELLALWYRRDNLLLNIVMLIYPFERIKKWQKKE
jgi:signal transduction histidine kinase